MAVFERDQIETDVDAETGVCLYDIGRAIMIWSVMNYGRPLSVAEAAMAFNTPTAIVRDAVEENRWTFLTGDETDPQKEFIEVDGE
jgi:hypothetical protein